MCYTFSSTVRTCAPERSTIHTNTEQPSVYLMNSLPGKHSISLDIHNDVYHTNGCRGSRVFNSVCRRVYFSPHDISKTDAARSTKLDTQMFHVDSWKPVYFEVKRSKVKVMSHKKSPAWVFALM